MEAVNIRGIFTTDAKGVRHYQLFAWTDCNAQAMEEAILRQQQRFRSLEIDTPRLLDLLRLVRLSAD